MLLLLICETLGLCLNTVTADDKYSLWNSENSPKPIKMQLYREQKYFRQISAAFLISISKFEHFE